MPAVSPIDAYCRYGKRHQDLPDRFYDHQNTCYKPCVLRAERRTLAQQHRNAAAASKSADDAANEHHHSVFRHNASCPDCRCQRGTRCKYSARPNWKSWCHHAADSARDPEQGQTQRRQRLAFQRSADIAHCPDQDSVLRRCAKKDTQQQHKEIRLLYKVPDLREVS